MDRSIKGQLWRAYACVCVCVCVHIRTCAKACAPQWDQSKSQSICRWSRWACWCDVCVCVLATVMQLMIVSPVCCFFFWSQCVCSYVWSRELIRFPCVSVRINVNNRMWAIHTVIPTLSLWGQASLCVYRVTRCVCVSMWGRRSKNNS